MKKYVFFTYFLFIPLLVLGGENKSPWKGGSTSSYVADLTNETEIKTSKNSLNKPLNSTSSCQSCQIDPPYEETNACSLDASSCESSSCFDACSYGQDTSDCRLCPDIYGRRRVKDYYTQDLSFYKDDSLLGVDQYRLQIGDRLLVGIYGEQGSQREIFVDTSGNINYLYVGSISALGKTIEELREELELNLSHYLKHAKVEITPVSFNSEMFTIMGAVEVPGTKPIEGKMTLLQAVASAGGFTKGVLRNQVIDFADLDHSFIARNGEYIPVDFNRLILEGDLSQDILLKRGDYVYIAPAIPNEVHVFGFVNRPTVIYFLKPVTMVDAIAEAGGPLEDASCWALVIRGSLACPTVYHVNIDMLVKGCGWDMQLCPGDLVYVPPKRFLTLQNLIKDAIRTFVGVASSRVATEIVRDIYPNSNLIGPSPIIPLNTSTTQPQVIINP